MKTIQRLTDMAYAKWVSNDASRRCEPHTAAQWHNDSSRQATRITVVQVLFSFAFFLHLMSSFRLIYAFIHRFELWIKSWRMGGRQRQRVRNSNWIEARFLWMWHICVHRSTFPNATVFLLRIVLFIFSSSFNNIALSGTTRCILYSAFRVGTFIW